MKIYTAIECAVELNVDRSRVLFLCKQGRLGYTLPKHGGAWVITQEEIDEYRRIGKKKPGRPKQPKPRRLTRVDKDGNHGYE